MKGLGRKPSNAKIDLERVLSLYEAFETGMSIEESIEEVSGHVDCWDAINVTNSTSLSSSPDWCSLTISISKNWANCSGLFEDMNAMGVACIATMNECNDLTTNPDFFQVADTCLPSCDASKGESDVF